jgi:hypothetical protein
MGLLKKFKRAVKKITKPVSRFLDKVVPNEIKPFLPYAAAAVPFLAPTSGIFATMAGRGALSGGANILSQLAQEGSEGDFSGLSALLAAGTGALSAPGAGDTLRSGIAKTTAREAGIMAQSGVTPTGAIGEGFLQGAENFARQGLGSMADATGTARSILSPDGIKAGLNRETLAAAAIPLGQGTTDLAMSTARKALKDYEDELAAYEAETGEAQTASDADRRSAIIAAMTAGQHSQDVIDETLSLLGLKDGGRVGLREGGVLGQILPQATSITSIAGFQPFMGRPAFAPLQQAQAVFPRLNQLEQRVDRA